MINPEQSNSSPEMLPPLWKHQVELIEAVKQSRAAGNTRGMAVMATGMGKTRGAAEVIREEKLERPDAKILWLAHLEDVKHQSYEDLQRYLSGHNLSLHEVRSHHEPEDVAQHDIVFGLFQTMKRYRDYLPPEHFDLIVVDESHHTGAPTFEPTIDYFAPGYTLGISGIANERELRGAYGPPIIRRDLVDGIEGGFLAMPDYWTISSSAVLEEDVKGIPLHQLQGKFSPEEARHYETLAIRFAEQKIADEGITDPRVLIFNNSIKSADHVASLREDMAPYHSKVKNKRKVFEAFRDGKIKWLSSVAAANEGLDAPDINVVIIINGGPSDVVFQEQIGRGLRKTPGKEKLLILDFTDDIRRLERIQSFMEKLAQKRHDYEGSHADPASSPTRRSIDELAGTLSLASVGSFHFDARSREIIDTYRVLRQKSELFHEWEAQDSLDYYRWLSQRLGKVATSADIERSPYADEDGQPSLRLLTRDFNNSLIELRAKAKGVDIELKRKEFLANWTREDSISYYLALYEKLGRLPTKNDIANVANEFGMPSGWALVKDFDGKLDLLRKACGFDFPSMDGLVAERTIAQEKGVSALTLRKIAQGLGFEAIQAVGSRGFSYAYSPEHADLLRQSIPTAPAPSEANMSAPDFIKSRNMTPATLNVIINRLGLVLEKERIDNKWVRSLSPEIQKQIDAYLMSLPVRPEGSYTIVEVAETLNTDPAKILRWLDRMGIVPQKYWKTVQGGYGVRCITNEEFSALCEKYDI